MPDSTTPLRGPLSTTLPALVIAIVLGGSLMACSWRPELQADKAVVLQPVFHGGDAEPSSGAVSGGTVTQGAVSGGAEAAPPVQTPASPQSKPPMISQPRANAADAAFLPEGVNQGCDASNGQSPVLLIHGTFANARRAFSTLTPLLRDEGFCVFALNYGKRSAIPSVYATGDMDQSADEIVRFIEDILSRTGAQQIDLVGHSQGGTLALHLGKRLGPAGKIRHIAAISPSTRGTLTAKAIPGETTCTACLQQAPQSDFIRRLHEGPVNPAGLPTLILATDNDVVVTPLQSQFVDEPRVLNFRLQELFPGRRATHSGILRQTDAMQWVARWLRRGQPPLDQARGL